MRSSWPAALVPVAIVGLSLLAAFGAVVFVKVAKHPAAETVDPPGSPEAAYRGFMIATLEGTEAAVRPFVVDRPGIESLWQGAYPPQVATLLAEQYRTMEISRMSETPAKVSLQSSASPVPLDVVFDGKVWRVDPAPIIAFRTRAK